MAAILFLSAGSLPAFSQGYASEFDQYSDWDWHITGLWSVDGSPQNALGGAYRSGNSSLNYNNRNGTFSTGGPNRGEATSTVINVTHLDSAELRFWCNYSTETVGVKWDRRFLRLLRRDGSVLESHQLAMYGGSAWTRACAAPGVWHEHRLYVPASYGYVKVSFQFDSVDHFLNDKAGWFVDDLSLRNHRSGWWAIIDAIADLLSPPRYPNSAWATTFEASTDSRPWSLSGLWAIDGSPGGMTGNPYYTESTSLNFNNGTDFNSGGRVAGEAKSPLVDVSYLQYPTVTFKCNYQTETTGTSWDRRSVCLVNEGGSIVADYRLGKSGNSAGIQPCDEMGVWHEHSLSIDPKLAKVRLMFVFDSVDGYNNKGAGWFIDDIFFDLPDIKNVRKEMPNSLRIDSIGGTRTLRFGTASGNAGFAPITAAREAFEIEHADGHNHLHFQNFVEYRLLDSRGTVASGRKTGFCFVNSYKIRKNAVEDFPNFGGCRRISPGWADLYGSGLRGQEIDVTNLPDGEYTLDYWFDPENKLRESDETNNTGSGLKLRIQGTTVEILNASNP